MYLESEEEVIKRIKKKLKEANMNQKELAEKMKISTSLLSKTLLNKRKLTIRDIINISENLNCNINELILKDEEDNTFLEVYLQEYEGKEIHIINNIKKIMKKNNIGQKELGDMVGVKKQTINAILKGRQSLTLQIMIKFSNALDVPINKLVTNEEQTIKRMMDSLILLSEEEMNNILFISSVGTVYDYSKNKFILNDM